MSKRVKASDGKQGQQEYYISMRNNECIISRITKIRGKDREVKTKRKTGEWG